MNYLSVKLWGEEIGKLVSNSSSKNTYFIFNPDTINCPNAAPITNPIDKWRREIPVYGDDRHIYIQPIRHRS